MTPPPSSKSGTSWWKSTAFMLAGLILLLASAALLTPKSALDAADGVDGTYKRLVSKLSSYLGSNERSDIVMLGSSVILTPAAHCDDNLHGRTMKADFYDKYVPEYDRAEYFERLIEKSFGKSLSIKNLGVASSIMSDQDGIFKLLSEEGKQPRLLILGLAPRDFLDNSQAKHLQTPTRLFIREYEERIAPETLSLDSLKSSSEMLLHRFQKVIGRLKSSSASAFAQLSRRQCEAQAPPMAAIDKEARLKKDLATYKRLYNPPNFSMLEKQSSYLQDLLQTASAQNVQVLVVNMPLSKMNTDNLDQRALLAYQSRLDELCRKNNAVFLNLGAPDSHYRQSDFEDSCHLNLEGGSKFYEDLLACLKADRRLSLALQAEKIESGKIAASKSSVH